MKFTKDILLFDFEGNHNHGNIDASHPSQLGAILLDKETLEEKKSFLSFINFDYSDMSQEDWNAHIYTKKDIDNAPSKKEVGLKFRETFGTNVLLCSWVSNMDMNFLERLMKSADLSIYDYDYHRLDLFPMAYMYLLQNGYTGGLKSQEMFNALGVKRGDVHNALEDCRFEVQILKKILLTH